MLFNYDSTPDIADEFTFITVSDIHYGCTGGNETGIASRVVVDEMNRVAGQPYPGTLGGNVKTPMGRN